VKKSDRYWLSAIVGLEHSKFLSLHKKAKMLYATLIPWATLCLLVFPSQTQGQAKTAIVDFHFRANLIVLKIVINGVPENFILDTGASRTTINRETTKGLGLKEAERTKARGVGGEVEASMVRVDSFAVGDIVLRDFTCGVVDMDELKKVIGGEIAGVLGFDFLSKFKITIDYKEKRLTFEQYEQEALEVFTIKGDRFISPKFKIELSRPDGSWEFITETPLPQIPVILEKKGVTGTVRIQVQEFHGLQLDQVIPFMESSISAQVKNFEKISSAKTKFGDKDCYVIEYKGRKDDADKRFKHLFFKVKENLYSVSCYANISEFASLCQDFDNIINSIQVLE